MADTFSYNIQQAGYDFDQYDLKGEATFEIFIEEFRKYPWREQVGNNKGGSEPTISVRNPNSDIDLWVSVVGTSDDFVYLLGIVKPKRIKTMFGFGKDKKVAWVTAYVLEKPEWVEEAFDLYFKDNVEGLNSKLSDLPVFLDQEATN